MERNKISNKAYDIYSKIKNDSTKLGDIKKVAREVKKDHELGLELWYIGELKPRLLATLIFDKKRITQDFINSIDKDMQIHSTDERNQLMDWLMSNQLLKDKETTKLVESWENSSSTLQRRTFWYYQARLRWSGKLLPDNTSELLTIIENNIESERPEVQWAMNFTAGWIGIYHEKFRTRCINIGTKTGLYKDQIVSKGCTPNYLPDFIRIEVEKRLEK